jgi:GAF domain-containing protein
VINGIQQAMGAALDFQAVVDVVGDKLREVFATGDLSIRWWNEAAQVEESLYSYEHGVRLPHSTYRLVPGTLPHRFYEEKKPLVVGSIEEQLAIGVPVLPGTDRRRSMLILPMLAGERIVGAVHLENHERDHAFGAAEQRLLETITSSMSVALENARLFAETQRLLKETEERNAELAVINSIQQGLVAQLDLQAIVDLVGDELRKVFRTGDLQISWFDESSHIATPAYFYEHGVRRHDIAPFPLKRGGRNQQMLEERVAKRSNPAECEDSHPVPGTDLAPADMRAPVVAGGRVIAIVNVDDFEDRDAFGDSEERLLTTVCNAMGLALQSAQLFDQTQRLLKETEQRNAELAVINSVQQGLAAVLDFQAIVDLVGDRLREVLGTDDVAITWMDHSQRQTRRLYAVEHGKRLESETVSVGEEEWNAMLARHAPLALNSRAEIAAAGVA